jgi:hypothetical protein
MATKKERKSAAMASMKATKGKPLGEGSRFKALEKSARVSGAENPGAVAASIGRKKYGGDKMAAMAAAGKKK